MSDEEKIKETEETSEAPNKNMDIDVEINEGEAGELQEKINELTSQLAEANDKYLRLYAEYDNYRKRTTKNGSLRRRNMQMHCGNSSGTGQL